MVVSPHGRPPGPGTPGLTGRIKANDRLSYPYQQTPHARGKPYRRMGYPRARFQQNARQRTDRHVGANAVDIDQNKGAVEDIEPPHFQKDQRIPVLDRNRPQRRQTAGCRWFGHARRTSMSPKP